MNFAADEDFNNDILRGLARIGWVGDVVRIQDTAFAGASDERVLEWCAKEGRILLTHDAKTVPATAASRIEQGLAMAGVIIIHQSMPIRAVIEDLATIASSCVPQELESRILYLPVR